MPRRLFASFLLLLVCRAGIGATQGQPIPVPLPMFPPNNWWNTDVSAAPVDPDSADFIAFINLPSAPDARELHPDFGGDAGDGYVYGFPYIIVDGDQPKLTVTFTDFGDESDGWDPETEESFPFYPVPAEAITMNGWVEGGQPGNVDERSVSDRHILIVDETNNTLYELYNVWHNGSGWEAASGAFFDMNTNDRRPEGWTSADAAGLAILPGLVRYDEVFGPDEIRHALRVTVRATNGHVYPASHTAGSTSGALPMGARLRLKASKNISSYAPEIQKIFRAFKKYGLIVADNGSDMYVSGSYDTRWNNDILNPAFESLTASDFEVVQLGWEPPVSLIVSLSGAMGAGDPADGTVTAYDPDYDIETGYTGTVHFTSTDGSATLPLNYTFTTGDAGSHTFPDGFILRTTGSQVVTATDVSDATINGSAGVTVGPETPGALVATASSTTGVSLSWGPSTGATEYEIERRSAGTEWESLDVVSGTGHTDSPVGAGATYLYRVRAIDSSSNPSPFSAPDVATTILFADDPLIAEDSMIEAVHFTQLRTAVNAMRSVAALGSMSFAPALAGGGMVRAAHVQQLRDALTQARAQLELSEPAFTNPTLVPGSTEVKAVHIQELRTGVK